jgi:PBP1b-binding outer membrane lipoprotein LpoB
VPRAAIAALSIVVVVALGILLFVSCSGDSSKPHAAASTTVPPKTKKVHALKIGTVHVESVGPPLQLSKGTRKAVLASTQKYVDTGVYGPLDSGAVASSSRQGRCPSPLNT